MQKNRKLIILISGTPGTGKSTISTYLSKILSAKYIDVGKFAVMEKLYSSYDEDRQSFIVDIERLQKRLKEIIEEEGNDIILDTHIVDVVPSNYVDFVIILRTDPRILEKRLQKKGYPKKKVKENVQAEILGTCTYHAVNYYGKDRVYELDTSLINVDTIIRQILEIINGKGTKYRVGRIDWLEILEKSNLLRKYFEDGEENCA